MQCSCLLGGLNPQPEESIGDQKGAVVAVDDISRQERFYRSLCVRCGTQSVQADEFSGEDFDSRGFACEPLKKPFLGLHLP